jgi:DNA-directed RNA polymerase subunit RPC12/RpoP
MSEATQDRHRCRNPRCRKPFALVYRRSPEDVMIPLTVACPRCGSWDVVMVTTGAVRRAEGTWVLPLGHGVVPHQTPSDLQDPHP